MANVELLVGHETVQVLARGRATRGARRHRRAPLQAIEIFQKYDVSASGLQLEAGLWVKQG